MGEESVVTASAAAPHLLLICFPGQGHVNPMLRLAKRFASKGLLVTFSSTSDAGAKITASTGVEAGGDGVPLGLGRIRFEFMDDHPDGDITPIDDLLRHLKANGPAAFAKLIRRQEEAGRPVACVPQEELERDLVDALPGVSPSPPPLIPVGPLVELEEDAAVRGDMLKAADDCVEWMDAQAPRSVVYASLGSVVVLSAEELAEMAEGLASTGRPFLWVVRPDFSAMLPEGYLDSVVGRVVVLSAEESARLEPSYAPAGKVLVSVSLVGSFAGREDAELAGVVVRELGGWFGAEALGVSGGSGGGTRRRGAGAAPASSPASSRPCSSGWGAGSSTRSSTRADAHPRGEADEAVPLAASGLGGRGSAVCSVASRPAP